MKFDQSRTYTALGILSFLIAVFCGFLLFVSSGDSQSGAEVKGIQQERIDPNGNDPFRQNGATETTTTVQPAQKAFRKPSAKRSSGKNPRVPRVRTSTTVPSSSSATSSTTTTTLPPVNEIFVTAKDVAPKNFNPQDLQDSYEFEYEVALNAPADWGSFDYTYQMVFENYDVTPEQIGNYVLGQENKITGTATFPRCVNEPYYVVVKYQDRFFESEIFYFKIAPNQSGCN